MIHQDAQDYPWGRYAAYGRSAGWISYGQKVVLVDHTGKEHEVIFRGTNGSGILHYAENALTGAMETISYTSISDYKLSK